jgi:uncharacterized spore protein YtfJ
MATDVENLLRTAFDEIKKVVTANIVIGNPLSIEGKTIIPVVGMSVDFGGGGGRNSETGTGTGGSDANKGAGQGAGEGAGGGFTIKPVALIIIDKGEVRIEHFNLKHLKFEKFSPQPAPEKSFPKSE